jgi:hypothetical protein
MDVHIVLRGKVWNLLELLIDLCKSPNVILRIVFISTQLSQLQVQLVLKRGGQRRPLLYDVLGGQIQSRYKFQHILLGHTLDLRFDRSLPARLGAFSIIVVIWILTGKLFKPNSLVLGQPSPHIRLGHEMVSNICHLKHGAIIKEVSWYGVPGRWWIALLYLRLVHLSGSLSLRRESVLHLGLWHWSYSWSLVVLLTAMAAMTAMTAMTAAAAAASIELDEARVRHRGSGNSLLGSR